MRKGQAALLIAAAILIMLGMLFLLENFLPEWMHITNLILPAVFLTGGIWFLWGASSNYGKYWGLFMPGSILTGLGIVFLITSYFPFTWSFLWPIILISIGIGFFLMAFFGRIFGMIIPAAILCCLGFAFFVVSALAVFSPVAWNLLWPLVIIFIGAALLLIFLLRQLKLFSFRRNETIKGNARVSYEPEYDENSDVTDTVVKGLKRVILDVGYGGGELRVIPMHNLNYVFEGYLPLSEVESSRDADKGRIKLRMKGGLPPFMMGSEKNNWDLKLTDQVNMDLDFKLGALKADIELGSLMIRSLKFRSGACDGNIKFSSKNSMQMEHLSVITGASKIKLYNLANANFRKMELKGGAGEYYFDFGGEVSQNADVEIQCAFSSVTINVPKSISARIIMPDKNYSEVKSKGWIQDGDALISPAFSNDKPSFFINFKGTLGDFKLSTC